MRIHRSLLALLALALLTVAACSGAAPGATTGPQGGATVAAASVKSAIESAAKVTLVEQPGSDSGTSVLLNSTTASTDLQFVAVFVGKDAATVKVVADAMKSTFAQFGSIKTYTNKNVIVFYAAVGGTDNSGAVDAAVKGL